MAEHRHIIAVAVQLGVVLFREDVVNLVVVEIAYHSADVRANSYPAPSFPAHIQVLVL
jgi:hypothetical protein